MSCWRCELYIFFHWIHLGKTQMTSTCLVNIFMDQDFSTRSSTPSSLQWVWGVSTRTLTVWRGHCELSIRSTPQAQVAHHLLPPEDVRGIYLQSHSRSRTRWISRRVHISSPGRPPPSPRRDTSTSHRRWSYSSRSFRPDRSAPSHTSSLKNTKTKLYHN